MGTSHASQTSRAENITKSSGGTWRIDDQSHKPCLQAGTASTPNSTQGIGSRDKIEVLQERENEGERMKLLKGQGHMGIGGHPINSKSKEQN